MQFVELFAGIGLFRLGLEALGPHWQCLMANDFADFKARAYALNFGQHDLIHADIATLSAQYIPHATELITASFPCQDVSLAGNRAGLAGERSGNFYQLARLLWELKADQRQPDTIVLENVVGLLTSHKGADLRGILHTLNELGYGLDLLLLDAAQWVPQSRPRVFIIGRLYHGEPLQLLQHATHAARPKQILQSIRANHALNWAFLDLPALPDATQITLKNLVDEHANDWFDITTLERELRYIRGGSLERLQTAQQATTQDGQTRYLAGYRRIRNNLVCLELRDDGLAGCLRTPTGGSSRQLLVQVSLGGTRIRFMTPREYARLMGVPDTFQMPSNTREALHGFGDAVAVPVVTWLGAALEANAAAPVHEIAPLFVPVA